MKKKSLLITTIAIFGFGIISMAQTVPSYVPTSGLVGWWPFTGNANDSSGNGNNGTVTGATLTSDRFGHANCAYYYNGTSNYIAVDNNPTLNNRNITLSAWYNAYDYGLSGQLHQGHIISKREITGWGAAYQLAVESTTPVNGIWATYTIGSNGWVAFNSDSLITSIWINAVYTHDDTAAKLYINGELKSITYILGGLDTNSLPLWFGARPSAGVLSSYFHGKLDDIGIWNRALDSCEIKDLYFASLGNCCHISISTQPVSQSATISNTAQFTTSSDSSATYQWQTDLGVGFQNINSVGQYSGTNKDTLRVANVTMGNNNQPFRCIVSSGACSDTSTAAVLTVINANGINETVTNNLFTVYPNPAKSQINVKADASLIGANYTVYNNIGKVTLSGKINTENTVLDLGHLSSGVYLFSIGDNLKQRFTVVKE